MRIGNSKFKPGAVGIGASVGLGVLGLALLCPLVPDGASAEGFTTQATQEFSVWAHPVIAISLERNVDLDIIPTSESKLNTVSSELKITTNNSSGYGVLMGMQGDNNDLISSDANQSAKISAITSPNNFTSNTWGYNISKGTMAGDSFSAVPVTATKLPEASTTTGAENATDTYTLTFGTQIDTTLPAGSYSNAVVISAVANPIEISNLTQLTYMQDMKPSICENTRENATKRLIDTRDGKTYWVAKLADGNCWMTQNLAFDLVAGKTLTPGDTDISSDWIIPTTTETNIPDKSGFINDTSNANSSFFSYRSWNLGDYVLATPLKYTECSNLMHGESFAQCDDYQDVSGWTATFEAQTGTWKGAPAGNGYSAAADGLISANLDTLSYDSHYLIGNYYQYNTATAGGAPISVNTQQEISTSICPAGWRLPSAGNMIMGLEGFDVTVYNAFVDQDDSFYNLAKEYGYSNSKGYKIRADSGGYDLYTTAIKGNSANNYQNNLMAPPTYFTGSGIVDLNKEEVNISYSTAYLWSSNVWNAGAANSLSFSTVLRPSDIVHRFLGSSIRCLAR